MEMNEAIETIQMQKSYLASLGKQLEYMERSIMEHSLAKTTLEGMQGTEVGTEMLIPVGGATKVFVTLRKVSTVIVSIGSGVEMEMPLAEAIDHHSSTVNRLTQDKAKLEEKYKELETSTMALSNAVEQAYAKQMQNPGMGPMGPQDIM